MDLARSSIEKSIPAPMRIRKGMTGTMYRKNLTSNMLSRTTLGTTQARRRYSPLGTWRPCAALRTWSSRNSPPLTIVNSSPPHATTPNGSPSAHREVCLSS